MAYFPTAAQARERGQGNRVIAEEISLLELNILSAIASGLLNVDFGGVLADLSASTTLVHSVSITASPMTNITTGGDWYNAWKGFSTDTVKVEQMNEVINHFEGKGFTISRKSSNSSTIYWAVSW